MARIEPEPEDFDPDAFDASDAEAALREGVRRFDAGEYHAAHEAFERCWLANEGADADFFKGLVQASICLHHATRGNGEGARKLYTGHRRLLAPFLPTHRGLDLARLLTELQAYLAPVLRDVTVRPRVEDAPRMGPLAEG